MGVMAEIACRAMVCALKSLAPVLTLALLSSQACAQPAQAYFADALWTGQGEPIHDGVMLVRGGVIVAVGPRSEVDIPARVKRHNLGAANLIPGLVVAQSNLVESTRLQEYSISPEVRAVDGFDPFEDYQSLLVAGITTVQISPGGGRLMPGQGAVVKLAGVDPLRRVLSPAESLRIILTRDGLSPPTVYEPPVGAVSVDRPVEPTKPQLATSLSQAIVGLRALLSEATAGGAPESAQLEALSKAIDARIVSRWSANNNAEIQAALQLSSQFNLPWIIVDPIEIDLIASKELWKSELARGVILNPELSPGRIANPTPPRTGEKKELPVWDRAKRLIDSGAGDRVALRASTDKDLEKLLFIASVLGRSGISPAQILKTITSNPARLLGVDDRVGSLKANADADFVVLSGTPFAPGTKLLATYAGGKAVYKRETQNEHATVIRAAQIYTPDGVLRQSSLSVSDGKIAGLGADVSLPLGAHVRDFGDAVIIPGMIDCSASLGMGGSFSSTTGLGTKLGPLLARDDDQVALGRQGGVTTALLSSTRLPSPVLAFKLNDAPTPLKDPVALRFEIKGNLTSAAERTQRVLKAGKSYADAWNKYDAELAKYKQTLALYEAAKRKYDAAVKAAAAKKAAEAKKAADAKKAAEAKAGKAGASDKKANPEESKKETDKDAAESKKDPAGSSSSDKTPAADAKQDGDEKPAAEEPKKLVEPKKPTEPKKPKASSSLDPYRALFAKKIPALVNVSSVKEVELAVEVFRKQFGLKTGIVAGQAAAERAKLLAENDVFVIVGPTLVSTNGEGRLLNHAAELAVRRVTFGFQSNASTGVSQLPSAISYAVYEGLGSSDALKSLTSTPASFFGLDSIGEITVGGAADLVVLSGHPMLLSTEVLAVMIDGKWVYEKESN